MTTSSVVSAIMSPHYSILVESWGCYRGSSTFCFRVDQSLHCILVFRMSLHHGKGFVRVSASGFAWRRIHPGAYLRQLKRRDLRGHVHATLLLSPSVLYAQRAREHTHDESFRFVSFTFFAEDARARTTVERVTAVQYGVIDAIRIAVRIPDAV